MGDLKENPLPADVQKLVRCYLSDLYVADMTECSLRGMVSEGYDGDHELVQGGYRQVVENLRDGYTLASNAEQPFEGALQDIRLNHEVTKVELNKEQGVCVATKAHGSFEADAVLVTLPLGVLKNANVKFEPPLPPYKLKAINRLGMGTENRVAMVFKNVFWPTGHHFLRPVFGKYTFANLHALLDNHVLCAWVRPGAIDAVEAMSDEEVMADVESVLQRVFKGEYEPPVTYHVTRWKSDPYSRGAYSFVKTGAAKSDYGVLSKPLTGDPEADEDYAVRGGMKGTAIKTRLYFAGEATSMSDSYTVHGAYMSGQKQAEKIAKWWREHAENLKDEE